MEQNSEIEALILSLRPGRRESVCPSIELRLGEGIDWTRLVKLAIEQRIVPLSGARLRDIGPPLVPEDICQALATWSERNRGQRQEIEKVTEEIFAELRSFNCGAVLLDGPAIGCMAYGDPALREPRNPIILFERVQLEQCQNKLTALGFAQLPKSSMNPGLASSGIKRRDSVVYYRAEDEAVFEACTGLLPPNQGIRFDVAKVRQRALHSAAESSLCPVPAAEDLLLIWSVLGGTKEWADLGSLCDLAWLIHRNPDIDLQRVNAEALEQGVERFLALGLGLVQKVFGVDVDNSLTDNRRMKTMVGRLDSRLREPDRVDLNGYSGLQWYLRKGILKKSHYLLSHLLPVRGTDGTVSKDKAALANEESARAQNAHHWGARSRAWEKWSETSRPGSREFSLALISAAELDPGDVALDLACGVGDTSLELGPLVGSTGHVVSTDLAFDMVARSKQRAKADGLSNLQACAAAMENLPFADGTFDGIVCRLGIMYCPNVNSALLEARRVLHPHAWAAYLVCGPQDSNPLLKIVAEVTTELFDLRPGDVLIDPFRFSASGSLVEEMEAACFQQVEERNLELTQHAAAGTLFWRPAMERGLSLSMDDIPDNTRQELENRMAKAFEPYLRGAHYELPSLSRITRGARPLRG